MFRQPLLQLVLKVVEHLCVREADFNFGGGAGTDCVWVLNSLNCDVFAAVFEGGILCDEHASFACFSLTDSG